MSPDSMLRLGLAAGVVALGLASAGAREKAGGPVAGASAAVSAHKAPYPAGPRSQAPEGFWDHWGDGMAELAGYALTQSRYGQLRQGEAVLVVVSETFTAGQRLKSAGGHGDEYPVLKLNEVRDFQTGVYDYNLMTSAYLRLDGRASWGVPTKLTMSMQEWCGSTFDQLIFHPATFERSGHSYFDGEGDQQGASELGEQAVFADALPMLLRGLTGELIEPGEQQEVNLWPRLSEVRMAHSELRPERAVIARGGQAERVQTALGEVEAETWTVTTPGNTTSYVVEVQAPRRLLAWFDERGEQAQLTGVTRERYWSQAANGFESGRVKLGLAPRSWPTQ